MTYLNELMAVPALGLYALVMVGMVPQAVRSQSRQTVLLSRAVILIFTATAIRLGYYDVWRSIGIELALVDLRPMSVRSQVFNALSNAWFAAALGIALAAMRESIPEAERAAWPWYRAPFYPGGCPIIRRRF